MKETENNYLIWSSGRVGCQGLRHVLISSIGQFSGMLSQLKLLKRQDLMGMALNKFRPKSDCVVHRIELDSGEMDTFVIAVGIRKTLIKLFKEYTDLVGCLCSTLFMRRLCHSFRTPSHRKRRIPVRLVFQPLSPSSLKSLNQSRLLWTKQHVSSSSDTSVSLTTSTSLTNTPVKRFQSGLYTVANTLLVFSENLTKLPETAPTLIFNFNFIESEQSAEMEQVLLQFVFHTLDRIRRYKLSREGKQKADKNRRSFEESFLKNTHQQRQEAAQVMPLSSFAQPYMLLS